MGFASFLPALVVLLFKFQLPVQSLTCSEILHGFLPLPGTNKCVGILNDKNVNWYQANKECQWAGFLANITLTMAKTSDKNALQIRDTLVKQNGDTRAFGWLDAKYNGVQYIWSNGEVIDNRDQLWVKPGHPILKDDYCVVILNNEAGKKTYPLQAYYSTPCTAATKYGNRKAFCEFDLVK